MNKHGPDVNVVLPNTNWRLANAWEVVKRRLQKIYKWTTARIDWTNDFCGSGRSTKRADKIETFPTAATTDVLPRECQSEDLRLRDHIDLQLKASKLTLSK